MKLFKIIIFLSSFNFAMAQNNFNHKVIKGENITQICKIYGVTPYDIYQLNPDASKGIQENMILVIPKKNVPTPVGIKHEVKTKETLFSIAQMYNVEILDIEKANPEITNSGINIGQILVIPTTKKTVISTQNRNVFHEIKTKETKYSIAKQYGITIEQLEKLNPEIATDFPVGFQLLIKGEKPKIIVKNDLENKNQESFYIIKAKETLYSLSNQFLVSQEELIALNPELKNGVQEGMSIKIPEKKLAISFSKSYQNLTKTIKKQNNKKLALLLPFNITKIDQDTINSTKSRLKKDKFLNMTLDFYAGALMAIDSVNKLGIKVNVSVLDSNESKSTSDISSLIQQENLKNMDAIIGPFYQNNVEKTAELLNQYNIPVISPLSKDYDKYFTNLIQATPTDNDTKSVIFDFMRNKNGNIIAIIDPKKGAIKQYISENHKDVIFVEFNEKGGLNIENLKSLLLKDKPNFVIMETEKTNLILSTTSTLVNQLANFDIKLVILSENDALDYEEIPMSRLTKLKMHFPSITKANETKEANIFENNFRKKNKVLPNQFATRGFDITFDTILRLNQEKSFLENINTSASEQVENKFDYQSNSNGGYNNKGVYILYYDTDLTIKEAK